MSVIIPNLNNAARLELCLKGLMQQSYPQEKTEIIVVDNGSTDGSQALCQKYTVRLLVHAERESPYWCRNAGIRSARGSIVALLDSNCAPIAEWLESGVAALGQGVGDIITGPVRFQFSKNRSLAERIDYLYSVINEADIPGAGGLPATHLFIRRELFEQIGYFIPHIRSLGDIEWTQRAKKRGYRFGFAAQATVDYPAKPFPKAVKKMVRLGGGQKELWVSAGQSPYHPRWIGKILKQLLPASPAFFRDMQARNREEKMHIPAIALYLGLVVIKWCYAWGMSWKSVNLPPDDNA